MTESFAAVEKREKREEQEEKDFSLLFYLRKQIDSTAANAIEFRFFAPS